MRSVDAKFGHTRVEHVEPLLPLTATDNLADSRRKDIHRRHGFTVTVNAHVEGFDLLWIVHHNNGLLRVLFRQIALVLRLKIDSPFHRKFEFLFRALKDRNSLPIVHAHKFRRDDSLELRDQALLDSLVEEREIVRALIEHSPQRRFQQMLRERGVVA